MKVLGEGEKCVREVVEGNNRRYKEENTQEMLGPEWDILGPQEKFLSTRKSGQSLKHSSVQTILAIFLSLLRSLAALSPF
jgi:hypothetical protein